MKKIFVDASKCTGCKSCEMGCAVAKSASKTLFGAISEDPAPMKRLYVEAGNGVKVPVNCRHCDEAPCVSACVSGCLYKDDKGFVRRHKERCIGCWSCIMACPFGVVSQDKIKHIAVKCDRCHKRDVPACVEACPTGALSLVEAEEFSQKRRLAAVAAEFGQPR